MSYHVYIAKEGWMKTPISQADWQDAVARVPELEMVPVKRGKRSYLAVLKGDKRQWLHLWQGYVHAQAPKAQLVAAMFELASMLDAKVYSERAKPYKSFEDWQKRTRNYYVQRERRINQHRRETRARMIRFLLGVAAVVLVASLIRYAAN